MRKSAKEGAIFRAKQQVIHENNIEDLAKLDTEIEKFEEEINVKSTNPLNAIQAYEKQRDVE